MGAESGGELGIEVFVNEKYIPLAPFKGGTHSS